jgi:tetratricopeptide (TPR) repeat protein
MGRSQKNSNFIDKTFTIVADLLLKVFPASEQEKKAFAYYREGLSAQGDGQYAEALQNYYEALKIEEDPYDRSFILYNIGLIHASNGKYLRAVDYYEQALTLNSNMPQALNNIAVIYHYQAVKQSESENLEVAKVLFDIAGDHWRQAIKLAPNNYIQAQNWLKTTGRDKPTTPYVVQDYL